MPTGLQYLSLLSCHIHPPCYPPVSAYYSVHPGAAERHVAGPSADPVPGCAHAPWPWTWSPGPAVLPLHYAADTQVPEPDVYVAPPGHWAVTRKSQLIYYELQYIYISIHPIQCDISIKEWFIVQMNISNSTPVDNPDTLIQCRVRPVK